MPSPKLVLSWSTASEAQWKNRHEDILQDFEEDYIEKIRYRPSMGGEVITTPAATREQKSRKHQMHKGSSWKDLEFAVKLAGEFSHNRVVEVENFMKMVASEAEIKIKEKDIDDSIGGGMEEA